MPAKGIPQTSVRRARREEWRELRDLRLYALKSEPLAFSSTLEEEQVFPDALWQERATRGSEASDSSTWVAVAPDGRLVGLVGIGVVDSTPSIFGMWLEPAFRGHGTGGRLLDAALAWGRRLHPRANIRLDVSTSQVTAVALYQSRGFHFAGSPRPPRRPSRVGLLTVQEMTLAEPGETKA